MSDAGSPTRYKIRVDGVLDPAWFDGFRVSSNGRQTVISGLFADQPALHGLLARIRDLGLYLVSVNRLGSHEHRTQQAGTGE